MGAVEGIGDKGGKSEGEGGRVGRLPMEEGHRS